MYSTLLNASSNLVVNDEALKSVKLENKIFDGKLISLNFQDIKVRSVLQLLADFTGINIVVSDAVKGNISLNLNDVPWNEALDIILTTQNLAKRKIGKVILVDLASSFIARENAILKQQIASQEFIALHSVLLQLNYAKAADIAIMLKDKTNSLLSARGSLIVDKRTNNIWLQETDDKIKKIRSLLKKLDIPAKQVVIEARIVDFTKNCEEDLGIRWGITKAKHLSGTLAGANQLAQSQEAANVTPLSDRLNVDLAAIPTMGQAASIGLALAKLGDGILLDLELSALESEGKAEIIASPKLMTLNQQPATISQGEDIPYQQSTSSGATAVAFKQAVLSLKVTPQITPDGKIFLELDLHQDVNSGQEVQGVPIILTKAITTSVLVNNGQTLVLGGIYAENKANSVTRVPFFGELPYVGHLFSMVQVKNNNEELLIFITPKIITDNLAIL